MKVIAIDPGYDRCGVAVLERENGKEVLVHSECIETTRSDDLSERLAAVRNRLDAVITEFAPQSLALETLYFSKNQKTAIAVAGARGVVLEVAAQHALTVSEYAPGTIKLAVTGSGSADKKQVMHMVPRLIVCPARDMLDDEYDAIAVGITHLAHTRS